MNCKDLMIGDWVNDDNRFEPCYILSLEHDKAWIQGKYQYPFYSYDKISPIPLTTEILKANGFIHKDTMDEWWHEEYDPTWGMQMSDFELTDEFMFGRAKITYVHELQHALRLCGLNELADNFKIQ